MRTRLAVAFAALLWPVVAWSQPSFDCARAATLVERTICAKPELAKADREMAAIYGALAGKLMGAAKDHLLKGQTAWLENRAKACTGGDPEVTRCLTSRYNARIATLKADSEGAYPFVSAQTVLRSGKVKATRYDIDASYPRFDGSGADFAATNKAFADYALDGAKNATPTADVADRESVWTYDQGFMLHRPGPDAVSVATTFYTFTGGAHGSSGVIAARVDLRSGRTVPPSDVFLPGSPWLSTISEMARADLKRQFVERPGFDDALQPANFAKLMSDPARYLFTADALVLLFNQYDVAAYVMGPYTVTIPYGRLSGLLRPDGPVGR
ncbi:MAG TPA: DUF3298 domain-containing protein [Reyranella sp.]|nr:DUF3298 domain-containing protein [Reyranella sp.]